jgi:hypothetical protein
VLCFRVAPQLADDLQLVPSPREVGVDGRRPALRPGRPVQPRAGRVRGHVVECVHGVSSARSLGSATIRRGPKLLGQPRLRVFPQARQERDKRLLGLGKLGARALAAAAQLLKPTPGGRLVDVAGESKVLGAVTPRVTFSLAGGPTLIVPR